MSVEVYYSETADNEMPTPEVSDTLHEICEKIESVVLESKTEFDAPNSLFVARSTWNKFRELAFQVHDPEIVDKALQALLASTKWKLEWSSEMKEDPEWKDTQFWLDIFSVADGAGSKQSD